MTRIPAKAFAIPLLVSIIISCNSNQDKNSKPAAAQDSLVSFNTLMDTVKLYRQVKDIASGIDGTIGVAVLNFKTQQVFSFNGQEHFPMQSVFKFPLAVAVMDQVDKGKISLDQKIQLTKRDLLPDTYSPLRDQYQNKNASVTLKEILSATVSHSDNNGCDLMFRLLGGTKMVNDYIKNTGIEGMNIVATEEEMHKAWDVQFDNWSTPVAMTELLTKFYRANILSPSSHDTLWQIMTETTTGPKRLKALLPQGTIIGHKTGTSDTKNGLTAAVNDVGIVILPNGNAFAIAVFVSNSRNPVEKMEEAIAKIGKAAWDSFK